MGKKNNEKDMTQRMKRDNAEKDKCRTPGTVRGARSGSPH
jgi:hypothetical protein